MANVRRESKQADSLLRARAGELLGQLRARQQEDPSPIFVEFAGTPKSGKSTCIDIVSHFFRRTGFRVHAPAEGASRRTPYYLKRDLVAYNAWCASYALSHILEGVYGSDRFDLAMLDRGLFDSLAWFELLKGDGQIEKEDFDAIVSFLMREHWRKHIDCVFIFCCDDITALQRENEQKLVDDPGVAMNTAFLRRLNAAYQSVNEAYSAFMPAVHTIDTSATSSTTPRTTASGVAGCIMTIMESRLQRC